MRTTVSRVHRLFFRWLRAASLVPALCIGVSIGRTLPAIAESKFTANLPTSFDIPAQALVTALNAYSAVVHVELFYDGALVAGRQSAAVQGTFTPSDALRRLLGGTQLVARLTDVETITISLPDVSFVEQLAEVKRRSADYWAYLARIQSSVRDAVCWRVGTPAEANDLLVRFWIAPSGAVARAELSTTAGTSVQDAAYADAIRTLDIGEPPPPGMPQPVTMMILARSTSRGAGCASAGRQATSRRTPHE